MENALRYGANNVRSFICDYLFLSSLDFVFNLLKANMKYCPIVTMCFRIKYKQEHKHKHITRTHKDTFSLLMISI